MGKKKKLKLLKRMAEQVAPINESTHEKHFMKASEMLENGHCPAYEDGKIDKDKMYQVNMPVLIIQNNQRRMKRAFLRNGAEGVKNFLNKNLQVVQSNIS